MDFEPISRHLDVDPSVEVTALTFEEAFNDSSPKHQRNARHLYVRSYRLRRKPKLLLIRSNLPLPSSNATKYLVMIPLRISCSVGRIFLHTIASRRRKNARSRTSNQKGIRLKLFSVLMERKLSRSWSNLRDWTMSQLLWRTWIRCTRRTFVIAVYRSPTQMEIPANVGLVIIGGQW